MSSNSGSNSLTAAMRVRLAADLRAARAADRRLQRIVGVDVRLDQEELELRRDDRLPALLRVQVEHVPQHVARRHRDRPAVASRSCRGSPARSARPPRARRGSSSGRPCSTMSISDGLIARSSSGYSPVTVCRKMLSGRRMPSSSANLAAGMILPRAMPAMSGTMASTSEMPCSLKNCWIGVCS